MRLSVYLILADLFCAHLLAILLAWSCARRLQLSFRLPLAFTLWSLTVLSLLILALLAPQAWQAGLRHWLYPFFSAAMVWNLLLLLPFTLGLLLYRLGLLLFSPKNKAKQAGPSVATGLTRRAFLYQAGLGAGPALALGAGVYGTATAYDLRLREYTVPIPGLPAALSGLVLAHVSDLHSGLYCGERRLKKITDLTNDLKADLILVTGDVINDKKEDFPPAIAALQRLRATSGLPLLVCEGNHDLIPGPDLLGQACGDVGFIFLKGTEKTFTLRGERIRVAGTPWIDPHDKSAPLLTVPFSSSRTGPEFRLTLAHHPDLFPLLLDASDLVLSGHTHGGQIMLGKVGFGPLFFNYWSGLYRSGRSTMIVSNGCGDWFPCRVGAPAEIGRILLQSA